MYINKHVDRCTGVNSRNSVRNSASYEEEDENDVEMDRNLRSSRRDADISSKVKSNSNLEDGEVANDSDEEVWTFGGESRPKRPATNEVYNSSRKRRPKKRGVISHDVSNTLDVNVTDNVIANDLNENLDYYVGNIRANAVLDDWEEHLYVNRLLDIGFDGTIDDESLVETDYSAWVHRGTWEILHQYQKDGCKWLYNLYNDNVGGILGDEMGLGKTAQICTHFGSLGRLKKKRHNSTGIFLIVCPATLLQHWLNEMHKWEPTMRTVILHGISKTGSELMQFGERGVDFIIRKLQREESTRALTLLVTYEGVKRNRDALLLIEWTGVALDEGQKIRNLNSEVSKVCKLLPTFHRIVISGTPIQNNLQELWNLFDFIYPGRIGSLQAFEIEFAIPIRTGGYANATRLQVEIANQTALMLQRIIQPYLLRRKKDDLSVAISLPQKTEQVLFCKLSRLQRGHYVDVLNSPEVQAILNNRMTSFRAITTLRKLCNHPILLVQKDKNFLRGSINVSDVVAAEDDNDDDDDHFVNSLDYISWDDSGKLIVLKKILSTWYNDGDSKVVLFSQTQSMLSLVERMANQLHFSYLRLDGSTAVSRRSAIIDRFNNDKNIFIILLTTRTGGLGISLTAANKVILLDPDWNPQTDIQARERAWRLGQKRDVTIYRLITRGTIEEKIYQRQIFKLLLSNRILDKPKQYLTRGIFSKSDIRDLFRLTDRDCNDDGRADVHLPQAGLINVAVDNGGYDSKETPEIGLDELDMLNANAYTEQVIANDSRLQNLSDDEEDEGGDAPSKSNSTDKKILQALFSGESIAAVYNHSYFESDTSDTTRHLQKIAERSVQQAYRQLTSSMPNTATVAHSSSSSSSVNNSSNSSGGGNRFGSSNGNESSLSSSLLSSLRGLSSQNITPAPRMTQNLGNDVIATQLDTNTATGRSSKVNARPTTSLLADLNAQVSGVPLPSATSSHASSSSSNAINTGNILSSASGSSLEDNIKARLQSIFATGSSDGLSTEFILNKFADLPDRFAPIFKAQLKIIAKFTNGKWVKA